MIQNLQELSLAQLRMIEDSLDSYLFKQPLSGEDFHKSYRKNKQSFDLLIKQTVKLQRVIKKAFQKQKEKLPQLVKLHRIIAASEIKGGWITRNGAHVYINDDPNGVSESAITSAKDTKEMGFYQSGLKEVTTSMPVNDIMQRNVTQEEFRDNKEPTFGRQVTKAIIVVVQDIRDAKSPLEVVDGWHRIRQAQFNSDNKIPVKVLFKAPVDKITAAEGDDDYINDDEWDSEDIDMAGDINVGLMPIYTNGAQTTAEELNIGSAIDASHAPAQKFLTNYSLKLARDINATTKTNIKQAIQTSLSLGENRDALTSRINDIIDNEYRSQMIAQTESIRAYSQGRLAVGRDIGYDQKTWNAQDDACTYCAALDGETIDINDSWDGDIAVVDSAPLHPNCRCDNSLSRSDDNVSAKEKLQSIKAGWITRNGAHVLLPDDDGPSTTGATIMNPAQIGEAALDRMDFTQPTKVPTDGSFSRYHAEHMLKYNAALQADHDRQNDPNIPTNIKDIIYSADVGGNVFPTGMAEHILENLPSGLSQNESLTKTLRQWGKSTEMVWKIKNNIQQQKTV
jgi:SPP1 gp7 family putative phage head morphogenesis protein